MANIDNAVRIATEFIKKWEKLSSSSPTSSKIISATAPDNTKVYAYYDSAGKVWTIGWGNTYYQNGAKIKSGDSITKKQADDLVIFVVNQKEKAIRSLVPYQKLKDNQYAALISITYNAGEGNFKASSIDNLLNAGASDAEVSAKIQDSIVTASGIYNQGLKNRRIDESKLFDGSYNVLYSYYLRNEKNVNYTAAAISILAITAISFWYYKKHK